MEGRYPPPKAIHPYPNNPNMTKFWGPYAKGFFRSFGWFVLFYGSALGLNLYLTRYEKGAFGMDWSMSQEDIEKTKTVWTEIGRLQRRFGMPLSFEGSKYSMDPQMRFDDGVRFNPPKGDVQAKAKS